MSAVATLGNPYSDMTEEKLAAIRKLFVQAHKALPGGLSLEVGTRRGGSARMFLLTLEELYPNYRERPFLFTVDPYGSKPYPTAGKEDVPMYNQGDFIAMKQLLAKCEQHSHFLMRSTDFLERMIDCPYWHPSAVYKDEAGEHDLGVKKFMSEVCFALLDGDHTAATIEEELALLYGMPWMSKGSIVVVDNFVDDPETKPMLARKYDATFHGDYAVVRGRK